MTKLNSEFFDKIAAKIIKEGKPDDLTKFMLAGKESIAAVQRYFYHLEAYQKKRLTLKDDEWSLNLQWFFDEIKTESFTGLALFKVIAPSIIPFVEKLHIANTQLRDYSFLRDIKNLDWLLLEFADDEHTKVLSALSSLEFVNRLDLSIKGLTLQFLSTLTFSFNELFVLNVLFEVAPKCDKIFQATSVFFYGDGKLMNDFVFTSENYKNYADVFPNADDFEFEFFIKVVDSVSDLLKVSNADHANEVEVSNRDIGIAYRFFDYSGYPDSKVLRMLEDDEDWDTDGCPYKNAHCEHYPVNVSCRFPLAINEIGNRLAEQSLRRIPEDSNGAPEDYYRLTLQNEWEHKAEFEVLKTAPVASLLQAYAKITGMDPRYLHMHYHGIYDGIVADNFQNEPDSGFPEMVAAATEILASPIHTVPSVIPNAYTNVTITTTNSLFQSDNNAVDLTKDAHSSTDSLIDDKRAQILTPLVPVKRHTYGTKTMLKDPLAIVDPEAYEILKNEKRRQRSELTLIASENYISKAVQDALGSAMSNRINEGYPGARYYAGSEYIDQIEILCQKRALNVFGLNPEKWGCNVQALSGAIANFAIYTGVVGHNERIMGLDLPDGGHLSHGYESGKRKVSATSIFFQSMPYKIDPTTGLIDYNKLEESAMLFRPKMIIAGTSCYSRYLDYSRFRAIADKCGAYLLADIAHISGLVAAGVYPSPFEFADIVMTTTHKSFRGPRGCMIFYRKGVRSLDPKGNEILYDIGPKIDAAVFPGLHAAPYMQQIAAMAVALKQCTSIEFREYAKQTLRNAQVLTRCLKEKGYTLATGGTDNHLCLVDMRPKGLDGYQAEAVLDLAHIVCNKNSCPGDKSATRPGGVRLGTPGLTTRGLKEADFVKVVDFFDEAINIFLKHKARAGKTIAEFKQFIKNDAEFLAEIEGVGKRVTEFIETFDMPGNDDI